MTNGEKIINDFPYIEIKDQNKVFTTIQIDTTGIGIPIIVYTEWWNKWWNAEYKEPTTKNDLALIHTEGLDEGIRCAMCTNSIKSDRGCDGSCAVNNAMYKEVMDVIENHITDTDKMIEPTTRNCFGCKYSKDNHRTSTEECHLCMWKNQYTPTTKNNLEVDCVSRKEVEKLVYRFLTKATDENIAFYEHFLDLPSVTPIRPKGHWISHREHCENLGVVPSGLGAYEWCSNCDCGIDVREWHRNHYNYCPNCGADMSEVDE